MPGILQTNPRRPKDDYVCLIEELLAAEAVLSVGHNSHKSFMWSVLAHLRPTNRTPNSVSRYEQYKDELNFEGIHLPMSLDKIAQFEEQNKPLTVNVYFLSVTDKLFPNRISPRGPLDCQLHNNHIDLLSYSNIGRPEIKYMLIKDPVKVFRHLDRPMTDYCKRCLTLDIPANRAFSNHPGRCGKFWEAVLGVPT